jgi:L-seryl-tRNA(Ser) seleniumtransferase
MPSSQVIPSIEQFLQRPGVRTSAERHGREAVTAAARQAAAALRAALDDGRLAPETADEAAAWMERHVSSALASQVSASLRRVINATGVIVHTNLGRAPLANAARARLAEIGAGYTNLEYNLDEGTRGDRHTHAERLLCQITGAEAAAITNNNAAATLLVLAALAAGREVIVSRGELVEIGGGFRVPDIMAQSGAALREVGTTNRTRVADYAAAISDRTGAILRVHPSNFRVEGFTERPTVAELARLARRFQLPLFEDLGSGWLFPDSAAPAALRDEPAVTASLAADADLVAFSGDKLLGGPQAGIIVGRGALIARVRRHPLMRAVRADKLTYAALEATLTLWAQEPARLQIPVYRMLRLTVNELDVRARALAARISASTDLDTEVIDGASTVGGGSAPGSSLPTRLVAIRSPSASASAIEARLRNADPPVIARIQNDRVVLDVRTVAEDEEDDVLSAMTGALTDQAG